LAYGSFTRRPALGSCFRCETFLERIHQIHHVLALGPRIRGNGLALPFGFYEFSERLFVMIFKVLWFELASLLLDDTQKRVEGAL
jgi:hypothetical protein